MSIDYFYPYQKEYYNSTARFEIWNKTRQAGISEIAATKSLNDCRRKNNDQLLVSSSQRQSNLLMEKIEKYIDVSAHEYLLTTGTKYKLLADTKSQKTFSNKKSVYCLPSSPETIRSFAGDVVIDEMAFHREDAKIYSALLPVITRGYSIRIISTPLGQSNMFYKIFTDEFTYKNYVRKQIDIYQAKAQGFDLDIDSIKNNCDEETFQQEYMCQFIDEATSYFTYELLKKCVSDYSEETLRGRTFIGIDIGRSRDLTAIAVIVNYLDTFYLKRMEILKNVNFVSQKEIISGIIRDEQPMKVLIDKGAIGMQLAEDLETEFLMCEGVQFNTNYKNELVTNQKKLMEQGRFKFIEDRELINDFHKIKRTVTATNQTNFDSKRDEQGHSDRAWACMLGCYAERGMFDAMGESDSIPESDWRVDAGFEI